MRRVLCSVLLCGSLLFVSVPEVSAWGDLGHRWVNRVAALKMPADMPAFLRGATDALEYMGPEPDRWRSPSEPTLKNAQEPDHFINLELLPPGELPRKPYDFERMLYAAREGAPNGRADEWLPERVGLQPYAAMEAYEKLKVALREYRERAAQHLPTAGPEQSAVVYAGLLGHYVADGAQPLHTTVHYNGWVGANPNGYTTSKSIHADFESKFVGEALKPADFEGLVKAPVPLKDPFADYVAFLRRSHAQVERLYRIEKDHGFEGKGTPEARAFTAERLADGSQMLLDLWYTAWVESANPPLAR